MGQAAASIFVRPFRSLSDEAEHEYFARGFLDDLITELARFQALEVFAETAPEAADYEVQGSIRLGSTQVRVNAQLLEVGTGRHLWAHRFDSAMDDTFAVQEEIASSVAGSLAAHLDGIRLERARRAPVTSLEVYDLWLRGRELLERGTVEADLEARHLFERAVELDPDYPRAYAGLSLAYYNDWSCQNWHLWDESEAGARKYAEKAVALDDTDPLVQIVLARVHLHRRDFDRGRAHLERAHSLNPNDPEVLANVALWDFYAGDPEHGLQLVERSMELNPRHGDWVHGVQALCLFGLQRYDEAVVSAIRARNAFIDIPATRAAAAAFAGNPEEARKGREEFLEQFRNKITFGREPEPGEASAWLIQVNPFGRASDAEHFAEGLRRAGFGDMADHDVTALRVPELPTRDETFRREDDAWQLSFKGSGARLTEVKGFHDLARLLGKPNEPVHCLELTGAPVGEGESDVLDAQARREIERRLRELREELDEARDARDEGRATRAEEELDQLHDELARALGIGGRARKLGSAAERARSTVTWRIRSAIKKVTAAHPRLGQHLANSVRTGTFCVYQPEDAVTWQL